LGRDSRGRTSPSQFSQLVRREQAHLIREGAEWLLQRIRIVSFGPRRDRWFDLLFLKPDTRPGLHQMEMQQMQNATCLSCQLLGETGQLGELRIFGWMHWRSPRELNPSGRPFP
jgi:hypothetical protein